MYYVGHDIYTFSFADTPFEIVNRQKCLYIDNVLQ